MKVARSALTALIALPLVACWNWNYSLDPGLTPPDRPRVDDEPGTRMPEWMRNPPISDDELLETRDAHRAEAEKSFTVDIRLGLPRHSLLADRSTIRIDLPIGYSGQPIGLAELTAMAIGDTPNSAGDRPSLRVWTTRLGGDLMVDVGATRTRFTLHIPTAEWETVLDQVAERLRSATITESQFAKLQDRLIQSLLDQWAADPAFGYASQWSRFGDLSRTEIIDSIQDRYLAELTVFQRHHYRPDGSMVGVWVPEVNEPDTVVASTRFGLAAWQAAPQPPPKSPVGSRAVAAVPNPVGVRWIEGGGRSRVAILIPNSSTAPAWHVMLECLTWGGLGGRLGDSLEDELDREPVFQVREIGTHGRRFLVLETTVEPKSVPRVWRAMTEAWKSLATGPPIGTELANAKARLRLRLARRQDHADEWLDAVGARDAKGGPIRDLHALAQLDHVRSVVQKWSETELAMVVTGGAVPDDATSAFTKVVVVTPEYRKPTEDVRTLARDTKRFLELAVQAVADKRTFAVWKGFEVAETWKDPRGLVVHVSTLVRPPNEMSRTTDVLGTRIVTRVHSTERKEITGTERVGTEKRELTASEASDLRSEANRHPLALLAGWVQDKIEFRLIGMRTRGGRKVALLERVDPTRSRLRITIDARSGLLRTVETVRRRTDTSSVLVHESYDDYRLAGGFRAPMHRVTKVGDDMDGVDAVVKWFKVLDR